MQTKTKLFIISGLIVLIVGLAAGAYFFLKAPAADSLEINSATGVKDQRDSADNQDNAAGQEHREDDQPAEIRYDENGEIEYQAWYLNGQLIKDQPPKSERP